MAASDARPFPWKNAAYRVTFPILDADGDLVTGAAGLDSEVSKDGGTFADCTNEATEIATSSGIYYLDLTATEVNADTVAIIVKTSTSGAKTTTIVLYPHNPATAQLGVNTVQAGGVAWESGAITGAAIATDAIDGDALAASAVTEMQNGLATSAALSTVAGYIDTEVAAIKAKTDNLPASPAAVGSAMTLADGAITAAKIATGAIDADALAADAVDAIIDDVVEGTLTLRQAVRIILAAVAGKSAGGGTSTITFRDVADTKNRISATVDANRNRTAVTRDGS